jgi:hypothetical protein
VIAEVYVAICQDRGDQQARVVFHAYDEDGRCKEVARYVPALSTSNQTAAQAILTALERLQKHGHTGTVVYTNLKAAVPRPDHRTYSGAEGFQALVDRIHLASVESGCEVAWCSSGHPRMGAARAVARDEREEASL